MALRDLHHVGAAVAARKLHHAQPVAMRVQPHGLGIDCHRTFIAGEIRQVAAMQAYGHELGASGRFDTETNLAPNDARGERRSQAFLR